MVRVLMANFLCLNVAYLKILFCLAVINRDALAENSNISLSFTRTNGLSSFQQCS